MENLTLESNENSIARSIASPVMIDETSVRSSLSYESLIHHLRFSLPSISDILQSPLRQSHRISSSSSLLLMPCWSSSPSVPFIGVKVVTHFPQNSTLSLPGVHAVYLLFDNITGRTLASINGTELTLWRTSCISALASCYLSREDARVLVMIGAGSLALHVIKAHLTVRPSLKKVVIWNRTANKARCLMRCLRESGEFDGVEFESCENLEEAVNVGDIVSCATNSESPLVKGLGLKDGAHLDLVGSFKPSMRECDDEAMKRGRVFVDAEAALEEAGEVVGAVERGVIGRVEGQLVELVRGDKVGRIGADEITVFKSVGSPIVDLLSAQLVYQNHISKGPSSY